MAIIKLNDKGQVLELPKFTNDCELKLQICVMYRMGNQQKRICRCRAKPIELYHFFLIPINLSIKYACEFKFESLKMRKFQVSIPISLLKVKQVGTGETSRCLLV